MNIEEKIELKERLSEKVRSIGQGFSRSPEQLAEYLAFASHFHQYSHKNLMMIYAQRPYASFVASASAWFAGLPDKNGRAVSQNPIYVRRGEKALYIWCPVTVNYYRKDGDWRSSYQLNESEQLEYKAHPELWQVKKEQRFKLVPVFDVAQVDCPKELLPQIIGIGVKDVSAALLYDALREYSEKLLHVPVVEKELEGLTLRGQFDPTTGIISINRSLEDTQKLSTLAHELGHAQLHAAPLPSATVNRKELEADMYSLMLEQLCGVETTDTRKKHLADHYKAFIDEQAKLPKEQQLTVDKVFDSVFAKYQEGAPVIQAFVELKTISPQQAAPAHQAENQNFKQHSTLKISKI